MVIKKKIKRAGINKGTRYAIKKSDRRMTVEEFERQFNNVRKKQTLVDEPKVIVVFKDRTSFLARDYRIHRSANGTISVDLIYGKDYVVNVPLDDIVDIF